MGAGGMQPSTAPLSPEASREQRERIRSLKGHEEKELPRGAAPFDTSQPKRHSWAPRRKPLAALAAGGLAGNIAVIVSWHFPMMPDTVVAAYASLAVTLVGFVVAYLVPSEDQ